MQKAVVSFELHKQRRFNPGQIYVALSRVTSLDGLFIKGNVDRKAIIVNANAAAEYKRLKMESMLTISNYLPSDTNSITFILSNVRSLKKHAKDILNDPVLLSSDVLFLTETKVNIGQRVVMALPNDMQIDFNNSSMPECSLATLYKKDIKLLRSLHADSISIVCFQNPSVNSSFTFILAYRKQSTNSLSYSQELAEIAFSENADIILGDFNINAFNDCKLADALSDYQQIVTEPTHLQGSLLDLVFIKKSILTNYQCESIVKCVFYSDHDVVKVKLQKRNNNVDFSIN